MLLAQLTALDEQSALFSCLAFGRTLSEGVDLAGRSFADLFAGSSTVMDRKEPAHYTSSDARNKAGLFVNMFTVGQNHVRPWLITHTRQKHHPPS